MSVQGAASSHCRLMERARARLLDMRKRSGAQGEAPRAEAASFERAKVDFLGVERVAPRQTGIFPAIDDAAWSVRMV